MGKLKRKHNYWLNEWALRDIGFTLIKMLKMFIYNYCNSKCTTESMKYWLFNFFQYEHLSSDTGVSVKTCIGDFLVVIQYLWLLTKIELQDNFELCHKYEEIT